MMSVNHTHFELIIFSDVSRNLTLSKVTIKICHVTFHSGHNVQCWIYYLHYQP